jgi:hypothetical protein
MHKLLIGRGFPAIAMISIGCLWAQYPGQYPPGQYPPGQYPPGQGSGGGLPVPRIPFPRRGSKTPADKKPSEKEVLQQFSGTVKDLAGENIAIEAKDTRIVSFKCTDATKFFKKDEQIKKAALKPGDEVSIDARQNDEGFFFAVNVRLEKEAPGPRPAPVETAAKPEPAPAKAAKPAQPAEDDEDAGRATIIRPPDAAPDQDAPVLRRGKPAAKAPAKASPQEPVAVASTKQPANVPPPPPEQPYTPPTPSKEESFIDKARQLALEFTEQLPNYICNQMTTRYQTEGRPVSWQPIDVVTAAVVYENGKESYHNIKINNKAVNKPMEELPGSWSRGEFGTTLLDLFSPATAAAFRFRGDSTASGLPAAAYNFQVERPNSHWETRIGGQSIFPAYKGAVWLDKKSMRTLRIEMQARNIPEEFPLDTVEWVVEYAFVRIGTAQFLLPSHAENLSCWRGSSRCARNAIDFRNYRKFTSESQIMATDSSISFEGDEPEKKPAPKK